MHRHFLVMGPHVVAGDLSNLIGCILLQQLPFQVRSHILERVLPLRLMPEDVARLLFCFR